MTGETTTICLKLWDTRIVKHVKEIRNSFPYDNFSSIQKKLWRNIILLNRINNEGDWILC